MGADPSASLRLDLGNQWVRRGGETLTLTPKAFAVLRHLAEHAGQLVPKQDLLDSVWRNAVVVEAVLATTIREIRKVLGDDANAPWLIETVHRRGYRLLRPLAIETAAEPAAQTEVTEDAPPRRSTTVGRDAELAHLRACWARAKSGGRQIVFVSGEAGIGKTALADAFLGDAALFADALVGRGQCIEQRGVGEAYLPLLSALGEMCRAPGSEHLIALLRGHAPSWLSQISVIRETLTPEEKRALAQPQAAATPERTLRELTEALEAVAAERPLVLLLEDLHWSDSATLDLITFLARRRAPARLLVIATYRPTEVILRDHPLKQVRHELQLQGRCETLALGSLDEAAVGEYLGARLGTCADASAARALAGALHRRTDGIALFVVAVVNDLLARGAIAADGTQWTVLPAARVAVDEVPASLREMIERQLDGLDAAALELLEAASVVGAEFSAAAVAAALETDAASSEARCEALARRGQWLVAQGSSAWPDGTFAARYAFAHALYCDVAYWRIPAGLRARLHLRVGEKLRTAFAARAGEIAAELALHFEQARDADRAARYLQQAADKALMRAAAAEAAGLLQRGLDQLLSLAPGEARDGRELLMQIALGTALVIDRGYVADEVERAYTRAWDLCERAEGPAQLLPVGGLYRYAVVRGEHRKGVELAQRMLGIAQRTGKDRSLFLFAHTMLGGSYWWCGELAPAREHMERSREFYDFEQNRFIARAFGDDPLVASLSFLAYTVWMQGDPDASLDLSEEALDLARRIDHPNVSTLSHFLAAQLRHLRADSTGCEVHASKAIELASEHGLGMLWAVSSIHRGWARFDLGDTEAGAAELQAGLAAYRRIGADSGLPHYLSAHAELLGRSGRPAEGLAVLDEAFGVVERTDERWWEAELHRLRGELMLAAGGRLAQAQSSLQRAYTVAKQRDGLALQLRAALSLARHAVGDPEAARKRLRETMARFAGRGDCRDLREAAALLAES